MVIGVAIGSSIGRSMVGMVRHPDSIASRVPPDGAAVSVDATSAPRRPSLQGDALVPVRNVRGQAERPHLGLESNLRLRVAMDQEHAAWISRVAGALARSEGAQPG